MKGSCAGFPISTRLLNRSLSFALSDEIALDPRAEFGGNMIAI
jgi:hypothetical protein